MSEQEDKPPTLASLRARSARLRWGKRTSPGTLATDPLFQAGLFSSENAASPNTTTPQSDRLEELQGESAGEFRHSEAAPQPGAQEKSRADPLVEEASRTGTVFGGSRKPRPPAALPTERRIWSVRTLVAEIRQHVETSYANLWIEGEISNCRPASSGHLYFTLKDGEAQLPVVLFRRQSQLLRFRPADGLAVLVRGRISVYETRGQLQLIAETMEPRGAGALQLAFEQLKARLLAEGLFDSARKRPLPLFPRCIGIITSPTGAVIRDIVTVIRRRHARLNLLVFPAVMQGASSPDSVARGIRWFNAHPDRAELIVIARGGGSMEDLACFNDEMLARTIAASALPVVSAIGHETDFTIADFVADLRAPTPSAAAELVTADQHRIEERLDGLTSRIHRAGRFHLMHARQRYARLSAESVLVRLRDGVDRRDQLLDELQLRLESGSERRLRAASQRLALLSARLARQNVSMRLAAAHRRLQRATERLQTIGGQAAAMRQERLTRAFTRLEALSPVAVLSRGYALIYSAEGTLLRSSGEVAVGERIHARLGRGTLDATVTQTGLNSTTDPIELPETPETTENREQ